MVPFFSNFRISSRLFSPGMEAMLLEQYEDVWVKASGSMLRGAEIFALIGTKIKILNEVSKKKDWQVITGSNPYNIYTLRRKGMSVYETFQQVGQGVCSRTSSQSLFERRATSVL